VTGHCAWDVVLPLYMAGINWTLVYDTIYAMQDKTDDIQAGIKSTAIRFQAHPKLWLTAMASGSLVFFCCAGMANEQGLIYYLAVLGGGGLHLIWQIFTLNVKDPKDFFKKFRSNSGFGFIIFLGLFLDLVRAKLEK